ncbi:MAG: radical SAM protein [Chloroflexi bacterium]|nr:radical SAM protein [Chloroflexota bacterium]
MPDIVFHAPGLRRFKTSEYAEQHAARFVSVSVTGADCALACEHCQTQVLEGMTALPRFDGSLFDLCCALAEKGSRGILVSGGCDKFGRVPLLRHLPDLIRARRELGFTLRVHPGLPDEETVAGLAEAEIDGAMVDIIGDDATIREVYHLQATVADYEAVLERLARHNVPSVPHVILGLHFGQMRGEWRALEMIQRRARKFLVLVILMPLTGTPMAGVKPPPVSELADFFSLARQALPTTPVMLGCARPMGQVKSAIDRAAVDAGLNGIAYPAEGVVAYARERGFTPKFVDACCGVQW